MENARSLLHEFGTVTTVPALPAIAESDPLVFTNVVIVVVVTHSDPLDGALSLNCLKETGINRRTSVVITPPALGLACVVHVHDLRQRNVNETQSLVLVVTLYYSRLFLVPFYLIRHYTVVPINSQTILPTCP